MTEFGRNSAETTLGMVPGSVVLVLNLLLLLES